jgi:hypothetical protein
MGDWRLHFREAKLRAESVRDQSETELEPNVSMNYAIDERTHPTDRGCERRVGKMGAGSV